MQGILDYMDNLTLQQIRRLFHLLSRLAFGPQQQGSHIQVHLHRDSSLFLSFASLLTSLLLPRMTCTSWSASSSQALYPSTNVSASSGRSGSWAAWEHSGKGSFSKAAATLSCSSSHSFIPSLLWCRPKEEAQKGALPQEMLRQVQIKHFCKHYKYQIRLKAHAECVWLIVLHLPTVRLHLQAFRVGRKCLCVLCCRYQPCWSWWSRAVKALPKLQLCTTMN